MLSEHLCKGYCFSSTYEGCMKITSILSKKHYDEDYVDCSDNGALLIFLLSYLLPTIKLRSFRRLLVQHNIFFLLQDSLSSLRRKLKAFIKTLKKGKCREDKQAGQFAKEKEKELQEDC
jgi:hypothetical protein